MGFFVFLFATLIGLIAQAGSLTFLLVGGIGFILFKHRERINELETQLKELSIRPPESVEQPRPQPTPPRSGEIPTPPQEQSWQQPSWIPTAPARAPVAAASDTTTTTTTTTASEPTQHETRLSSLYAPEPPETAAQQLPTSLLMKFFRTGNPIARIGGLLLFLGVGFGLKFAADEGYFPPELRLIVAALFSMVLLAFGVKVRNTQKQFSLIIQGTGVGIFYITTYIASARYGLIPPLLALILLSGTTVLTGVLAVVEDARALAILALFGGFLAPILSYRPDVNHIALFSYLGILNLGICAMCWFRSWRSINLTGFFFTFLISANWAESQYTPDHYLSCQTFLIFFAGIYTAINILYSVRHSASDPAYLDAAMTFGTPFLYSLFQWGLTAHFEYGTALSCLAFGSAHVVMAQALHTTYQQRLRALVESYLAIGFTLLTLGVPFLLDGAASAAIFALEGVALTWSGIRHKRRFAKVFGVALLPISSLLFLSDSPISSNSIPFLNAFFFGVTILTVSFIVTGALFIKAPEESLTSGEREFGKVFLTIGCLWWALGGWYEQGRHIAAWLSTCRALFEPILPINAASFYLGLYSLFATASVYLFHSSFTRWKLPGRDHLTALLLVVHICLLGLAAHDWYLHLGSERYTLLGVPGIISWPLFFAVLALLVFRQERDDPHSRHPRHHTFALWMVYFLLTRDLSLLVAQYAASGWVHSAIIAVPAALVIFVSTRLKAPTSWPLSRNQKTYCAALRAPIALSVFFSLLFTLFSACETYPIPYLPLLNPLDLAQLCTVLGVWSVVIRSRELGILKQAAGAELQADKIYVACGLWLWIWSTSTLLRTLHHFVGIPWNFWALFNSPTVQTTLSIFWTLSALALMLLSQRTRWRLLWKSGAVLIGVVVTKLFLVDLANQGTLGRILAFLGVGVLLLSIGYFAPLPPERARES